MSYYVECYSSLFPSFTVFNLVQIGLSECYSELFQHEAGCAAYEDTQKKMTDIQTTIGTKTTGILSIQNELEKNRLSALEARKVKHDFLIEQEALIPLEQAARYKVAELSSVMESETSQGSVLKAILQAKEMNGIHGIYGRMGDLGATDGESFL